ncbi:MAG: hypothetical protein KDC12_14935 [Flavobacteriales bacterium]|nr:hypothetical protein [Flavobacteriales bacterium]
MFGTFGSTSYNENRKLMEEQRLVRSPRRTRSERSTKVPNKLTPPRLLRIIRVNMRRNRLKCIFWSAMITLVLMVIIVMTLWLITPSKWW